MYTVYNKLQFDIGRFVLIYYNPVPILIILKFLFLIIFFLMISGLYQYFIQGHLIMDTIRTSMKKLIEPLHCFLCKKKNFLSFFEPID